MAADRRLLSAYGTSVVICDSFLTLFVDEVALVIVLSDIIIYPIASLRMYLIRFYVSIRFLCVGYGLMGVAGICNIHHFG